MFSLILLGICTSHVAIGHPVSNAKALNPKQLERFYNWTENDKQNIWELSGQFEGDMILNKYQRNGVIFAPSLRWPNREISYMIDSNFSTQDRNKIINALQDYTTLTCITPILITEPVVEDYVLVTNDLNQGCVSDVGKQGGVQEMNLNAEGCLSRGIILHEFLHALGFVHQHSSTERDDFVIIHYENIDPDEIDNFEKYDSNLISNFSVQYDYGSIMHYSATAYSINGLDTIQTIEPNAQIGQRDGFSQSDILKLELMYNCTLTN